MSNTLNTFALATTLEDTDLLHLKRGTGVNSDKKITGATVKAVFATAAQGALADTASQPGHTHTAADIIDSEAYTSAEQSKLAGIEAGATADQSDAEIEIAYNNQVNQVSAGEKTAGTETAIRRFSPKDIADMAGTHGGGGGGGSGYTVQFKNSAYTAVAADKIYVDCSGGAITITLPITPSSTNEVIVIDSSGDAGTNNITVDRNGETIDGVAADFVIDQNHGKCAFAYDGSDWKIAPVEGAA